MLIFGDNRASKLAVCLEAAGQFLLSQRMAEELIELQLIAIRDQWLTVCEQAELTPIERNTLWRRQILNPFIFEDAPKALGRFETGR
jgi:serine/threonine-protein kinase HipA